MTDAELEPELNAWLIKRFPNLEREVEPASLEEIRAMERYASRELPRTYRWYLARMGRHNGPFKERTLDLSIQHVLRCYADGTFEPDPRFTMIAVETDPIESEHLAYDFEHPVRDDARVVRREVGDSEPDWTIGHETFRERFIQMAFVKHAVLTKTQQVRFRIESGGESVPTLIDPLLRSLGFSSPCETGQFLGVYETADCALFTRALLDNVALRVVSARMGVDRIERARSVLGEIASIGGLRCVNLDWIPKLDH